MLSRFSCWYARVFFVLGKSARLATSTNSTVWETNTMAASIRCQQPPLARQNSCWRIGAHTLAAPLLQTICGFRRFNLRKRRREIYSNMQGVDRRRLPKFSGLQLPSFSSGALPWTSRYGPIKMRTTKSRQGVDLQVILIAEWLTYVFRCLAVH